ncbi:hypothetical protein PM082_010270 [Marasmius tenuissimus]|nr:hypothetical protein PM082_010270 [Marasmius tenuissimus]
MAYEDYNTDGAAVQAQGVYQQFYDAYGNDNDSQQQQRHQQSYITGTGTSSSEGSGEESMLGMGDFTEMDMREYGGMTMDALGASMPGMHPVRVSIPQYMSSTPMLAPGGGAEVLPAGLLNSSMAPPPGVSWYANSGLLESMQEYSPISIQHLHRQGSQSQSSQPPSQTTQSPFDYDAYPSSATPATASSSTVAGTPSTPATSTAADPESRPPSSVRSPPSPPSSASKALNLNILNGSINPAHPITASQLSAIGISSTANASPHAGLNAPSSLGLPVYSASGFDLLSVMARVATRPDPKVVLGPVDLTSSFVVVDVRRHDCPVIYVSPTFCRLTGYDESDVIGRNCRFLQSPNGIQSRGEVRQYTSHEAVKHLKKNLVDNKECQTSIINYKKNGDAFINLVTVIPIRGGELGASGDEDKVVYHVGFQVDLTEQPNAILQKLKDGTYIVNYTANNPVAIAPLNPLNRLFQQQQHRGLGGIGAGSTAVGLGFGGAAGGGFGGGMAGAMGYGGLHTISAKDRKLHAIGQPVVSQEFRKLLDEPEFLKSFPVTTGANADAGAASTTTTTAANSGTADNEDTAESGSRSGTPPPPNSNSGRDSPQPNPQNSSSSITIPSSNTTVPHASSMNHPLSLILLEYTPDFLHVVSLKGDFLYVAPAVRRVLGYESHELVGQSLVDICHPSDRVPLVRELKESSSSSVASGAGGADDGGGSKDKDLPDDVQSPTNASDPHALMALHRPRTVDLLFRALTKSGRYVWVECRGRLHVEPGKGRKAILLSGRAKEMAGLRWEVVKGASGGVRGVIHGVGTGVGKDKNKEKDGKDGLGKETNGSKKRKKAGSGGGDEERTDPVHSTTEEADVKSEFWGTITRNGIILVVTSGVRDVLGFEEGELTGKHIEQFLVTGEEHSQLGLVEEIRNVRASVGSAPDWGVRTSRCWMTRKKQSLSDEDVASESQPGQGNAVEVEVVLYPSSVDDSIRNAEPQTISPANVIYQIRAVQPSLSYSQHPHIQPHVPVSPVSPHLQAASSDSLESEPDVLHPLEDDVFEPLDTTRGSSWQYELQQLRFRNDRLKEEIRVMEGELEKASLSSGGVGLRASVSSSSGGSFSARRHSLPNVMSPTTANPHSRQSSGSQQQHPYMQYSPADTGAGPSQSHYPIPVPVSIPVSYDARHQGQPLGSPEYPSQQQDWRSVYMPPPAHPHTQPHAQMPVAMNLTLPPRYAQQSQQRYQLPHQPPTPSSLKRTWDAGGNGGGGDT